ncbi:MAG TPA: transglutaminaseTgpA domain-containing protein [Ktedonobacteraceae bacterium]
MRSSMIEAQGSGIVQQQERDILSSYQEPHALSSASPSFSEGPLKRLVPAEGWSPLVLLAIALYCVVTAIISVKWVDHSNLFYWSPVLGLLLGLGVAKVRGFSQAPLHVVVCLGGYWFSLWMTCTVAYHVPWSDLFVSFYLVLVGGVAPQGLPANDVAFFFYLCFLCFFLGYFGCWLIYHARMPWLVALVYCSIVLVNLNYVKHDPSFLIVVLAGALLLLVARVQLASQLLTWAYEGLHADLLWRRRFVWRCMQAACLLGLVVTLCSWVLPVQSMPSSAVGLWNGVNNAVSNITNGHISLDNPSLLFQPYQTPSSFFSDQLTISGSVQLPSGEVLQYTSSDGPHYLEGYTLDHFDGHTWINVPAGVGGRDYPAGTPLPPDVNNVHLAMVKTSVTIIHPPQGTMHYIFAPAQPQTFDVATTVYGDTTAESWVQQSPLAQGETYNVTSVEPSTNTNGIHDIPLPQDDATTWQRDNDYLLLFGDLQLPSDLSQQVQKTVIQWTKGAHDTYSALKMLESHLSDTAIFTYSTDNAPVPSNVDAVDWLLQTRRGYCTYYATAMTVMARMLGIPARVTNGFSQGTPNTRHDRWSVAGSDAHSWVQAYLPGYGWVSFDPTPGFAAGANPNQGTLPPGVLPSSLQTPTATAPTPSPTPAGAHVSNPHGASATNGNSRVSWWLIASGIASALLAAGVFILLTLRRWWRNLYRGQSFASGKFWRLCRLASWIGLGPRGWQTPYEYGEMLSRYMPQQAFPLWCLTNLYVHERWGASTPTKHSVSEQKQVVERSWRILLGALLRSSIYSIKQRFTFRHT